VQRRYNFAEWWHLLSLDAPTVAGLWSWFFARAMHLRVPMITALLLAAATWLFYVADRILDGLRTGYTELRERHIFHARHRRSFILAAIVLAGPLLWLVLTRMDPRAIWEELLLAFLALLYLLFVHAGNGSGSLGRPRWLPKEFAVGILFAAATAVPAWSRLNVYPDLVKARLAQAVVLFAVLCWINCVAIEKWEAGNRMPLGTYRGPTAHASTRWAGAHLQSLVSLIGVFFIIAAGLAPTSNLTAVYLAGLFSSCLFLALDTRRSLFSPLFLRIAADAALLTPVAFLPILKPILK
jgi:hypothetical protein